jgi:aspartate carbamoyltransferase catalytic subunit
MGLQNRSLISTLDFSIDEQDEILTLAEKMMSAPKEYSHLLGGRIMASLFFEPSTRTRLSFESAMLRLGGQVIGFSEAGSSSAVKGESLSDTIRTVCQYSDIIVIRHPKEGAANIAACVSGVPVVNAGDGGHEHPTQTLTDLLTIRSLKKHTDNLVVGCCGDLKFGRTVHSLVKNISRYSGVSFVFASPDELRIPQFLRTFLDDNSVKYIETDRMDESIAEMDVLYMTRVQRERFFSEEEYIKLKDLFILDLSKMEHAKQDMCILHPLPRVNEIAYEVDNDKRAAYFHQVGCGMYARMALMAKLLGIKA